MYAKLCFTDQVAEQVAEQVAGAGSSRLLSESAEPNSAEIS
jgi:hypothetical protein